MPEEDNPGHLGEAVDARPERVPTIQYVERDSLWQQLMDWLFGRDFFISYRWDDGRDYAVQLAEKLKGERFDCFLDSDGFIKGDNWQRIGDRELKKTNRLVLVGSPKVHESDAVVRELQVFGAKSGRIIAIEFGDSLSSERYPDSPVLKQLDANVIRQREPIGALEIPPSDELIAELRRTFTGETTAMHRLRVIQGTAAALFLLVIIAAGAAVTALWQRNEAVRQANIATARQLAAQADLQVTRSPDLLQDSLGKAIQAVELAITPETTQTLRNAMNLAPTCLYKFPALEGDDQVVGVQHFASSGSWMAVTFKGLMMIRLASGKFAEHKVGDQISVGNLAIDPAGQRVMVCSADSTLGLFSVADGTKLWSGKIGGKVKEIDVNWRTSRVLAITDSEVVCQGFASSPQAASGDFRLTLALPQSVVWAGDSTGFACSEEGLFQFSTEEINPVATGVLKRKFDGIYSIEFNAAGNFVLIPAGDSQMLWSISEKRLVPLSLGWSMAMAASKDGKSVAVGGRDGVRLYKLDEELNPTIAFSHLTAGIVTHIGFSPDERYLVACVDSTHFEILAASNGRVVNLIVSGGGYAAGFSSDSSSIMTGGARAWICRINDSRIPCPPPEGSMSMSIQSQGFALDANPDSTIVAVGDSSGFVTIACAASGNIRTKVRAGSWVNVVRFSPDGNFFAAGSRDGWVRVWDAHTFREVAKWQHADEAETIEFNDDGTICLTGSLQDPELQVWDARGWSLIRKVPFERGTTFAKFVNEGKRLVVGSAGGKISFIDTANTDAGGASFELGMIHDVSLSNKGGKLALAAAGEFHVFDCQTSVKAPVPSGDGNSSCIALSPDGRHVAGGAGDIVSLWDAGSGGILRRFDHGGRVNDVAFDRSGKFLLTSGGPKTIQVWNADSGELISTIWQESESEKIMPCNRAGILFTGGNYSSPYLWYWSAAGLLGEAKGRARAMAAP